MTGANDNQGCLGKDGLSQRRQVGSEVTRGIFTFPPGFAADHHQPLSPEMMRSLSLAPRDSPSSISAHQACDS